MHILGLNVGHNSTACLLKNGKIIGCVSEERFNRIKNCFCFPYKSVEFLLRNENIDLDKIDLIITTDDIYYPHNKKPYNLSDTWKLQLNKQKLGFRKIKGYFGLYYPYTFKIVANIKNNLKNFIKFNNKTIKKKKILNFLCSAFGKDISKKIILVNHHELHAFSSAFNINDGDPWLVFTLDGEGGGLSQTLNIYQNGNLRKVSQVDNYESLGHFYGIMTYCLGMKVWEHEFKVMGLAPYAKEKGRINIYNILKKYFFVDNKNLKIRSNFITLHSTWNLFLKEFLIKNNERFDNISAGVQKLTEELIREWVISAINRTGIHNVALSGGVFMNVKVNQKISEIPEVNKIFITPSCGDEANAIGACFYGYKKYCEENNITFSPVPLKDLYLGPKYTNEYIEHIIKRDNLDLKYKIKKINNINKEVANLLSKGHIIARCSNKSEWGARALGNRSILANAKNPDTIRILNETIKDRDFWMPFTPSIIEDYEKNYILNPKKIFAPYMCITFNPTNKTKKDIPAAIHPYDQTLRPQIVTKEYNPDYYEIIKEFSKITGVGGILNTSFNLHGEPNVLSPEDALHTVNNSNLKYLVMENYLFEKRD